jgi:flagella basal body P-ring formation protein FlgA
MKYLILLFFLTCNALFAQFELKKEYLFNNNTILSSDIFPHTKEFTLFTITPKKMSYRIKSKELIKKFKKHHINATSKVTIITFKRAFSFDMTPLHVKIKEYYKTHYNNITIKSLHVRPKSYIEALPDSYTIHIPPKNFHRNEGTFYIKTARKKKLFFTYTLKATLPVVITKKTIARKETITPFNTKVKTVNFIAFKSPPLSKITSVNRWCANIRLKEGRILKRRDIRSIPLVKRNQNVIAVIQTGALHVELSATAQNDGALYDMITIQKSNGEKLKARVIGANRVEIK